jgi:DnaJ-class molecular chaperone
MMKSNPKEIKALACKYLSIPWDIINPKTIVKIPNEGFPFVERVEVDDPENVENDLKKIVDVFKFGDLIIRFNIKIPNNLSVEKRQEMLKVLRNEDE